MPGGLAPMSVAQMMDKAIEAYRQSYFRQILCAAAVSAASVALMPSASAFLAGTLYAGYLAGSEAAGMLAIIVAVVLPLMLFWQSLSSAGFIFFAWGALAGHMAPARKIGLPAAFGRAFCASVALALVFAPVAAALFFAVWHGSGFVQGSALAWPGSSAGLLVVLLLAMLAATLFALVENMFALAVAAAIFEDRLFFGALARSWTLVKRDYFAVLAARLLWYAWVVGFAVAAFGMVFIITRLVNFVMGTLPPAFAVVMFPLGIIAAGFSLFVSLTQIPMDGVMRAVVYFNQRIKVDGLDIEMRLGDMARRAELAKQPGHPKEPEHAGHTEWKGATQ